VINGPKGHEVGDIVDEQAGSTSTEDDCEIDRAAKPNAENATR